MRLSDDTVKRVETRLAAWWSAWKYVVILLALLVASVVLNLQQWKGKAVAKAEGRAEALADLVDVNAALASGFVRDARELGRDLAVIVERGRTERVVYRDAAATKPLAPNCAPGQARVDAVNAGRDP